MISSIRNRSQSQRLFSLNGRSKDIRRTKSDVTHNNNEEELPYNEIEKISTQRFSEKNNNMEKAEVIHRRKSSRSFILHRNSTKVKLIN